jgi:MscS family membrane protein
MTRAALSPGLFAVVVGSFLGFPGALTRAQEKPDDKHRSPRATVRTLFTAITVAKEHPRLIQDAVSCLDLTGLPAGQPNAGLLATQLEAVLRSRDVDTELLPDKVEGAVYVLPDAHGQRIGMARTADGRWLFDRETVASVPKLYAEVQKDLREKNKEAAALNVSPDYASPRATLRTLVNGYRRLDFNRILGCLDLEDIPTVARQEVGRQTANKLKQILVRYRLPILQEVPDSNYSDPYVWLSQPEGVIELVRLPAGSRKGEWVFSRDTVRSINKLYPAFEDKPYLEEIVALGTGFHLPTFSGEPELWLRSHLPGWLRTSILSTRSMKLEVYEAIGYVLVPVLAFGLSRLTTWLLAAVVHWFLTRRRWALPRETVVKRLRPAGRFAGVLFLRWGLLLLEPDPVLLVPLLVVLNPLVWVLGVWAIYRVIDLITEVMEVHLETDRRRPELTQMLWPVGSLAIKIGLFVLTLFYLMALFSWDVTAVLTGLGIGGLAFALGAQDSLKNLFGSFTLIADRPFVVGETVKIGDQQLGVVEVVGLRCTRIRAVDDTVLIVPNSNLTTMNITNFGRRRYRRSLTNIGVAYSTPLDRLVAFRDGIKDVIRKQERTRKDHFEVSISDLAASAIEIQVSVYFDVPDRYQELVARDALILDLLRLAQELNIELAYPTQTIHLVPPAEMMGQPLPGGLAHNRGGGAT